MPELAYSSSSFQVQYKRASRECQKKPKKIRNGARNHFAARRGPVYLLLRTRKRGRESFLEQRSCVRNHFVPRGGLARLLDSPLRPLPPLTAPHTAIDLAHVTEHRKGVGSLFREPFCGAWRADSCQNT